MMTGGLGVGQGGHMSRSHGVVGILGAGLGGGLGLWGEGSVDQSLDLVLVRDQSARDVSHCRGLVRGLGPLLFGAEQLRQLSRHPAVSI